MLWASSLAAQVRLKIDPKTSLAWWQIAPHMRHLWASTCPDEPSWQPGDIYSIGYVPKLIASETDTVVPLYPRFQALPLCRESVHGEIATADTVTWRGTRGLISIQLDSLVSGYNQRDEYARKRILETVSYPEAKFQIDSLVNVQTGDTLHASAVGVLELHGAKKPWSVPIKAWREQAGLRVTGHFDFPPQALVDDYHMSPYPLSLGVGMRVWRKIHLGIDAVLVPVSATPRSSS